MTLPPSMLARGADLMETVDHFGVMHIVVEDGNFDDENLAFVAAEMAKSGATDDERELLALLSDIDEDDRYSLWGYC